MSNTTLVRAEIQAYELLRDRLIASYPELDDDTIRDTLEGITHLHELICEVIRWALIDEALQVGLRTRMEDMRQRLTRLEERGAKKTAAGPGSDV